jgi:hypothetical protein
MTSQAGSANGPRETPPIHQLQDCTKPMQLDPGYRLRLGTSVALQPSSSKIRVWSAATRSYLYPDPRLQLLLFAFVTEKPD